jgi:3-keto-L-gulonate-6-phosphate decarboxylase
MSRLLFFILFLFLSADLLAQQTPYENLDSLKKEILELRADVDQIQLNLKTSQNKFKRGIAVATIGYSVTIAGGLMLGRRNDELGKGLLIAGGATGVTGTILMVDAFRHLTRKRPR